MRASLPAALLCAASLVACDQDYAASNSDRETRMGDAHAAPSSSAPPPAPPALAPPPIPALAAPPAMIMPPSASAGDAGAPRDAAPDRAAGDAAARAR